MPETQRPRQQRGSCRRRRRLLPHSQLLDAPLRQLSLPPEERYQGLRSCNLQWPLSGPSGAGLKRVDSCTGFIIVFNGVQRPHFPEWPSATDPALLPQLLHFTSSPGRENKHWWPQGRMRVSQGPGQHNFAHAPRPHLTGSSGCAETIEVRGLEQLPHSTCPISAARWSFLLVAAGAACPYRKTGLSPRAPS